jgi:hypothetical protein
MVRCALRIRLTQSRVGKRTYNVVAQKRSAAAELATVRGYLEPNSYQDQAQKPLGIEELSRAYA